MCYDEPKNYYHLKKLTFINIYLQNQNEGSILVTYHILLCRISCAIAHSNNPFLKREQYGFCTPS